MKKLRKYFSELFHSKGEEKACRRDSPPQLPPRGKMSRSFDRCVCNYYASAPSLRPNLQDRYELPLRRSQRAHGNPEINKGDSNPERRVQKEETTSKSSASKIGIQRRPTEAQKWLRIISRKGWYWGNLTVDESKKKLKDYPDGSFLIRDSSNSNYIFTVTFKHNGDTFHQRLAVDLHIPGEVCQAIIHLVENEKQVKGVRYNVNGERFTIVFPLLYPVSRFTKLRSLQDLSRFVIRQNIRLDHIQTLEIPKHLKGYLQEYYF